MVDTSLSSVLCWTEDKGQAGVQVPLLAVLLPTDNPDPVFTFAPAPASAPSPAPALFVLLLLILMAVLLNIDYTTLS